MECSHTYLHVPRYRQSFQNYTRPPPTDRSQSMHPCRRMTVERREWSLTNVRWEWKASLWQLRSREHTANDSTSYCEKPQCRLPVFGEPFAQVRITFRLLMCGETTCCQRHWKVQGCRQTYLDKDCATDSITHSMDTLFGSQYQSGWENKSFQSVAQGFGFSIAASKFGHEALFKGHIQTDFFSDSIWKVLQKWTLTHVMYDVCLFNETEFF